MANRGRSQAAGDLLQIFLDGVPRTRAELVEFSGLARSTVGAQVSTLLGEGLLIPSGDASSSGGRPPSRLVFNPAARAIVAVDLGATHGRVAITGLDGNVLSTERADLDISDGPERVLTWVVETAESLLRSSGRSRVDVVGVGIGLPAPVEHKSGKPVSPPIMPGWDGFSVPKFMRARFGNPVLVDNDVNLLALGEHAAVWPDVSDLLFVKVSTGIGAGIISNGGLLRGAQGSAGDMGHVMMSKAWPGGAGGLAGEEDLEAIASGPAIATRLRARGLETLTNRDVVALIGASNADAVELTRESGRHIGEILAMCVNLLNPTVIVIGGSIGRASQDLLAGVKEVVYRRSTPLATQHLLIVPARGGEYAGVRGASLMVSQYVLSPSGIEEILDESQRNASGPRVRRWAENAK